MSRKGVFIDRDGVINRTRHWRGKERAPLTLEDFEYLPGVADAIGQLKAAGYVLVVVTNQPDVSRGWQTRERVDALNAKVLAELAVDCLKACFHGDEEACACRKPRPGMLLEAAREHALDLARCYMIGDRESDVEAGRAAGCRTILIQGDPLATFPETRADYVAASLLEAARYLLESSAALQDDVSRVHHPRDPGADEAF